MAQGDERGTCGETVFDSPETLAAMSAPGEFGAPPLLAPVQRRACALRLPLDPVCAEGAGGSEILRYREAGMAEGRLYKVRRRGERHAVPRPKDGLEIPKFHPDGK